MGILLNGSNNGLDIKTSTDSSAAVFVVGLAKTGTACVKSALEQVRGDGTCLHLDNFLTAGQVDVDAWIHAISETEKTARQQQLRQLLKKYTMASGVPITSSLKDLLEMYPTAKFILTVRSAETWLATCRSTIIPKNGSHLQQTIGEKIGDRMGLRKLEHLKQLILRKTLGETVDFDDDTQLLQAYVRWNDEVERLVPKSQLLVFHVKEGWGPLCRFLHAPQPAQPFPPFRERRKLVKWIKNNVSNVKHLIVCCTVYTLFGLLFLSAFNLIR